MPRPLAFALLLTALGLVACSDETPASPAPDASLDVLTGPPEGAGDVGLDPDPDPGGEPDSGPSSDADVGDVGGRSPDGDAALDVQVPETLADTPLDGAWDPGPEADAEPAPEADAEPAPEADAEAAPEADAEPAPDTGPDTEPDVGPQPCTFPEVEGRLVHGAAPPLVGIDPTCGRLTYGQYANQDQDNAVHILPDYSWAGYQRGGVALPEVPVVLTLAPSFGDNHAAIQAAIDEVSDFDPDADGFRGAILLEAGTWEVSDTLTISTSGVVLRGEGQGADGTILVATKPDQHDLIRVQGSDGLDEVGGTRVDITSDYVPVGSRSFEVESAAGFSVGDVVGVARTPNEFWVDDLEMSQWGWSPGSYEIDHERVITDVNGDVITVDIPIVDTMEAQYGGGALFLADTSGRVEQVGIEDLRLVSEYDSPTDEDHGWNAITFARTANSWVRRVTSVHFGYAAVNLTNNSSFNTIVEVAQLDPISQVSGGRRYSFNVSGGTGNLFIRCFARDGRHNFVTGARVPGPHVWVDCLSVENNNDEGPHHRWATGLLFDNISSAEINVQNREDSGTGHGWAGAQTAFWNVKASTIRCDAPRGAMNWAVGVQGIKSEGKWNAADPYGWWESEQSPVVPRSLYLAQLEDRLGSAAVANVAIAEQLEGGIWPLLNGWAGEGKLADADPDAPLECEGIQSGNVCCPASCGQCGGSGCGSAPGGAQNCCSSAITEANLSCAEHPPPCLMP